MGTQHRSFDHEKLKNAVEVYLLVDYKPETGRQTYHGFFVDKEAAEIFREYQLQELGSTSGTTSSRAQGRYRKSTRSATLEIRLLDAEGKSLEEEDVTMLGSKEGSYNREGNMFFARGYSSRLNWPLIYGYHRKSTSKSGDDLSGQYVIGPFFVGKVYGTGDKEMLKPECYYDWIPTLKLETANKVRKLTAEVELK